MSGSKVCLVLDRRERGSHQVILGLNWFKKLSAKYPGKLQVVLPDYPTIFAGTILEEILDTTADMASGVIWALLWKVLERDSSNLATLKSKKPIIFWPSNESGYILRTAPSMVIAQSQQNIS